MLGNSHAPSMSCLQFAAIHGQNWRQFKDGAYLLPTWLRPTGASDRGPDWEVQMLLKCIAMPAFRESFLECATKQGWIAAYKSNAKTGLVASWLRNFCDLHILSQQGTEQMHHVTDSACSLCHLGIMAFLSCSRLLCIQRKVKLADEKACLCVGGQPFQRKVEHDQTVHVCAVHCPHEVSCTTRCCQWLYPSW